MGLAYLPDGRRMDYEKYLKSPEWRNKKRTRLAFDNWQCGICHAQISDDKYETHHLNYSRLGDEDIEHDILTLCHNCHAAFHSMWQKVSSWESSPYTHWRDYSLQHTVWMCKQYLDQDFICGNGAYNLCNADTAAMFIDSYFEENAITEVVKISVDDVRWFIRNKRYDIYFKAVKDPGFNLEDWLDVNWGKKGGPGGNPARAEARRFFTKHKIGAMKRIYRENDSINILMEKAKAEEVKHE